MICWFVDVVTSTYVQKATGGTASASVALLKKCGAEIVEFHCAIELSSLHGRSKIDASVPVYTLWSFD